MISALEEVVIDGIDSNVDFHISILNNNRFREVRLIQAPRRI